MMAVRPLPRGDDRPLAAARLILAKDLRIEWRTRELVTSMGLLALLLVIVFGAGRADPAAAPTAMWVTYAFGAAVGFARTFALERGLHALRLAPVDGSAVVIAKTAANWLALLVVQALSLPVFAAVFTERIWTRLPALVPPLALGGFALAVVGTLFGAILAQARLRDLLLPLLLLPIVLPALIAAVSATASVLDGQPLRAVSAQLQLLLAFDILFAAASVLLFDVIVAE
jgi:heme exporter protein B